MRGLLPTSPTSLIVTGAKGDTRRYRTFHLWQQLRLAGMDADVRHISQGDVVSAAANRQVLVLHRTPFDGTVNRLIETVRRRGGLVLADVDDLIFDPSAFQWINTPDFADPVRASLYQHEMQLQQRTLLACDAALASTDYLADIVRGMGKPAWVHRNAANLEMLAQSERARNRKRPTDGRFVIGYASGTPTHNLDFASISTALMQTLDALPRAVLWLIGPLDLAPEWQAYGERVRHFEAVSWRELPTWLAQVDVNLAPLLLDNPFSQSKSEIKFMEAALVGVSTIASATDAYQYAIRHGENGLLARNVEEWQVALLQLADPENRAALAEKGLQDALNLYTPQVRARQLVETLNKIAENFDRPYTWQVSDRNDENIEFGYWPVRWENLPTNLALGWYSLKTRGLSTLLKQIWITLRRFLARWIPYR